MLIGFLDECFGFPGYNYEPSFDIERPSFGLPTMKPTATTLLSWRMSWRIVRS